MSVWCSLFLQDCTVVFHFVLHVVHCYHYHLFYFHYSLPDTCYYQHHHFYCSIVDPWLKITVISTFVPIFFVCMSCTSDHVYLSMSSIRCKQNMSDTGKIPNWPARVRTVGFHVRSRTQSHRGNSGRAFQMWSKLFIPQNPVVLHLLIHCTTLSVDSLRKDTLLIQ